MSRLLIQNVSVSVGQDWAVFRATCLDEVPGPLVLAKVFLFLSDGLYVSEAVMVQTPVAGGYALEYGVQRQRLQPGAYSFTILVRDGANKLSRILLPFSTFSISGTSPVPVPPQPLGGGSPTPSGVSPPSNPVSVQPLAWSPAPVHTPEPPQENGVHICTPYWPQTPGAPRRVVGMRWKAWLTRPEASGNNFKITFGWHRLWGPAGQPFLLEANLYSVRILYTDGAITTYPPSGTEEKYHSSVRFGITDYPKSGRTGVRTLNPVEFPRQRNLVDGIPNLTSFICMSQQGLDVDETELWVDLSRGDFTTDLTNWRVSAETLPPDTYRQWVCSVLVRGKVYRTLFVVSDSYGQYIAAQEMVSFVSEFWQTDGRYTIRWKDVEYREEGSESFFVPITEWVVTKAERAALRGFQAVGNQIELDSHRPGLPSGSRFTL